VGAIGRRARGPQAPSETEIEFTRGVPAGLEGQKLDPVALIEKLEGVGAKYGIGRGIHLGDTIIGTKGRVAFEAPAAEILIAAHRELEKLTLTLTQSRVKEMVSQDYGQLIHEGKQLDPACRDIEALFTSSQQRVTERSACSSGPAACSCSASRRRIR
jgi:argininosuccinate synthase